MFGYSWNDGDCLLIPRTLRSSESEAGRLEGCGRWVRGNVGASALRDGPAGLLRV